MLNLMLIVMIPGTSGETFDSLVCSVKLRPALRTMPRISSRIFRVTIRPSPGFRKALLGDPGSPGYEPNFPPGDLSEILVEVIENRFVKLFNVLDHGVMVQGVLLHSMVDGSRPAAPQVGRSSLRSLSGRLIRAGVAIKRMVPLMASQYHLVECRE